MGIPLSQLIGGASFKFDNMGDTVRGKIVSAEQTQQSDLDTGLLEWWDDGHTRPKLMLKIVLATELRDTAGDDGLRTIYAKGGKPEVVTGSGLSMEAAIIKAVQEAGASSIDDGGDLAVRFTGEGKKPKPGFSAPKLYTAKYKAPAASLAIDDFAAPATPVVAAPVAAPAPAPVQASIADLDDF